MATLAESERVGRVSEAGRLGAAARLPRLLLVEDNDADAYFLADALDVQGTRGGTPTIVRVTCLAHARAALGAGRFDAVLLDLSLPDATGIEAIESLTAGAPDVPVVVMTGLADDALAARAVAAGAQDYLIKGQTDAADLRHAVRYAIERHRLSRERQELLERERIAREAAERGARQRDEVLGIVSHDLRNPLATIGLCARALHRGDPAERDELVDVILRSSEMATRIIRDLLDVTAIEAGRLPIVTEAMTVSAIAETLLALFRPQAEAAGVTLSTAVDAAVRWVEVDVDRLVQALGNLVSNAIRFTPRGGSVTLSATTTGGTTRFSVTDTGPGIPAADVPHLFDRFWQARTSRRGGAGLGLAIAKGIAEAHGGRIEVESEPGHGSAFTLVIPPPRPIAPTPSAAPRATRPVGSPLPVLDATAARGATSCDTGPCPCGAPGDDDDTMACTSFASSLGRTT